MEVILLFGMTGFLCVLGMGLFRLAAEEIGEVFPRKWYWIAVVCSLCIAGCAYWYYGEPIAAIGKYLTMFLALWVCAWTDRRKLLILNRVLLLALLARVLWLAVDFLVYGWEEFQFLALSALLAAGMLAAAALLCKAVSPGAVGAGDVKLLAVLGLYTGTDAAMGILLWTFLALFAVCVALLLMKKVNRKTAIPFAPFLAAGMAIASFLTGM